MLVLDFTLPASFIEILGMYGVKIVLGTCRSYLLAKTWQ